MRLVADTISETRAGEASARASLIVGSSNTKTTGLPSRCRRLACQIACRAMDNALLSLESPIAVEVQSEHCYYPGK
jgi:hypothetical protein